TRSPPPPTSSTPRRAPSTWCWAEAAPPRRATRTSSSPRSARLSPVSARSAPTATARRSTSTRTPRGPASATPTTPTASPPSRSTPATAPARRPGCTSRTTPSPSRPARSRRWSPLSCTVAAATADGRATGPRASAVAPGPGESSARRGRRRGPDEDLLLGRSRGRRDADPEPGAPVRRFDRDRPAVGGDDRGDDAEPEAAAGPVRLYAARALEEPFEDPSAQVGGDAGALVDDIQHLAAVLAGQPEVHARARRGVVGDVAEQVDQHLA